MTVEGGAGVAVIGIDKLLVQIDDLTGLAKQLREPTAEILDILYDRVTYYPPELPNQQYERTFDLEGSWGVEISLKPTELGRVVSVLDYNQWVQDEDRQARIHQGRWEPIQQIAEEEEETAVEVLDDFIQRRIIRE